MRLPSLDLAGQAIRPPLEDPRHVHTCTTSSASGEKSRKSEEPPHATATPARPQKLTTAKLHEEHPATVTPRLNMAEHIRTSDATCDSLHLHLFFLLYADQVLSQARDGQALRCFRRFVEQSPEAHGEAAMSSRVEESKV